MGLEMIKGAIDDSVALLKRCHKELFVDFLKIYLLYFLVSIIAFIGIFGLLITDLSEGDLVMTIFVLAVAFIAYFAAAIISGAIYSVGYVIIKNRAGRSKVVSIISKTKELLFPIGRYSIITWVIILLIFIPPVVVYLAIGEGVGLIFLLLIVLSIIALIVFMFLIQFSMLEIALAGKGAIESIKESARKARSHLFPVLGLDILLLALILVLSTAFMAISQVAMLLLLSHLSDLLVLILVLLFIWAMMLIQYVLTAMFVMPLQYFFWKRIR